MLGNIRPEKQDYSERESIIAAPCNKLTRRVVRESGEQIFAVKHPTEWFDKFAGVKSVGLVGR